MAHANFMPSHLSVSIFTPLRNATTKLKLYFITAQIENINTNTRILLITAIIFFFLADSGISKDIKILSSYDRIR